MKVFVFDLETDGLYDQVTKVHSLVYAPPENPSDVRSIWHSSPTTVQQGLDELSEADAIVGHNVVGYDVPVLDKLFPLWRPSGGNGPLVLDTMLLSQLLWPSEHLRDRDFKLVADGKFPAHLIGRYSLEAWGYRLGEYKGDFKGPWDTWTQEMQDYCVQDVQVTVKLWNKCLERLTTWGIDPFDRNPLPGKDCVQLEHRVAEIISRQERRGVTFNTKKAEALFGKLSARMLELEAQLTQAFPPDEVESLFIPKANNGPRGYVKGVPVVRHTTVHFNPSSRQQVAERLKRLGWVPTEFTPEGSPKVDDDILNTLPYPQAKLLAEYYMVEKRLAQVGGGKQGWLRAVKNGRIHGRVTVNGAVTGRMTHSSPNLAQVPAVGVPYGKECRELFEASKGYQLVGCDADALELRCLAHFLAKHDDGAYIATVLEGKKELGTDMHTLNAKALGCSRDVAKTWFYAFIYGAGDWKLGFTLTGQRGPKQKITGRGKQGRTDFLTKLPAMGKLVGAVKAVVASKGYLVGLDGRRISIRSDHAALNSLLQSAGALLMKRAAVLLFEELTRAGIDFWFVLNIHDEWQIEVAPEQATEAGKLAAEAIRRAGDFYSFRCPLAGNYVIGNNWAETH
jgi:DNA polymerase-1